MREKKLHVQLVRYKSILIFFFIIKPFQLKMNDFSEFVVDAKDFDASEILMQFNVLNL